MREEWPRAVKSRTDRVDEHDMPENSIVDRMRPLALVVDSSGTILVAEGGFGGIFGIDIATLPGTSVFDHVDERDVDELAMYFVESIGEAVETVSLPLTFRIRVLDADGWAQPVDVIPTGQRSGPDDWTWVVILVPVAFNASISRSLDLEMAGASRDDVRRMLCEELVVDNIEYTSRWLLIDLADPSAVTVTTSRPREEPIAQVVGGLVRDFQWSPWTTIPDGTSQPLLVTELPERFRSLMIERGWTRVVVTPVHVDGMVIAAFVLVGRVPDAHPNHLIKTNVSARIQSLVRATAMLATRWRDQDRLVLAATRDSLTGLANREVFLTALASERRTGAVLYVDIDHFKSVNDRFGHRVGDAVLRQVAHRIADSCRDRDVIARFGGDEFVVLLRGVEADTAQTIAQRIIDRMGDAFVDADGAAVSVSIGVAMISGGRDSLGAADEALLAAKRAGRGRYAVAA